MTDHTANTRRWRQKLYAAGGKMVNGRPVYPPGHPRYQEPVRQYEYKTDERLDEEALRWILARCNQG